MNSLIEIASFLMYKIRFRKREFTTNIRVRIKCASFGLRNTKECSMTYRQSEMYNRAKYLKNLPLQSVSSRKNLGRW